MMPTASTHHPTLDTAVLPGDHDVAWTVSEPHRGEREYANSHQIKT